MIDFANLLFECNFVFNLELTTPIFFFYKLNQLNFFLSLYIDVFYDNGTCSMQSFNALRFLYINFCNSVCNLASCCEIWK